VAVREFATAAGPVDYALFVNRMLCRVIEAKPAGTTLSGFSEQAARYIAAVPHQLVRSTDQARSRQGYVLGALFDIPYGLHLVYYTAGGDALEQAG
jgi:type I site-specific restriction endonuclease